MSFITAQNCEGVTRDYLDINEKMRDFVRFRIRKRDIKNINVVDRPTGRYGAIYCIDVLEHLVDWKSTVQALVKDHTEVGSYFVHNSPFGRTSEHPMHFGSDVGVPYVLYPYGFRAVKGNYDVLERKR
jgi:hypothetical protein